MPDTAAPALAVLENPHQHLCKDLENDGVYVIDIKLPHRSLISGVSISACSTLRVLCVEGSDCETPEEEVTAQPPRTLTNRLPQASTPLPLTTHLIYSAIALRHVAIPQLDQFECLFAHHSSVPHVHARSLAVGTTTTSSTWYRSSTRRFTPNLIPTIQLDS